MAGRISLPRRLAAPGRHRAQRLGRTALVTPMEPAAQAAAPEHLPATFHPAVVAAPGRNGMRRTAPAVAVAEAAALRLGTPPGAVPAAPAAVMAAVAAAAAGMASRT